MRGTIKIQDLVSDMSRLCILMELYQGPLHGYAIMSGVKKRLGKDVSPSLVYPFLRLLEQKGFVEKTKEAVGLKTKKVYRLTKEGRGFSERMFKRLSKIISVAIEPSLDECAHCGCKVYEGGNLEVIEGEEMVFCCKHCAMSYKAEKGLTEKG